MADGDTVLINRPVETKRLVKDDTGAQEVVLELGEVDGTVKRSLYGKDDSDTLAALRTDAQKLLRSRPYEPYRTQAVADLTGAWATVYTCPADSIARVVITFGQTSVGDTTYEAALRVKGCALISGLGCYVSHDAPPPMLGPFTLAAGDLIEAYRVAGADGAVLVDIELFSTGDVNTGV